MATHHDEDTMPEETQGYKLSQPKQSIAEYQQMGTSIYTFRTSNPQRAHGHWAAYGPLLDKCAFNGTVANPMTTSKCFVTCD